MDIERQWEERIADLLEVVVNGDNQMGNMNGSRGNMNGGMGMMNGGMGMMNNGLDGNMMHVNGNRN